jgi:hypothetical protein
MTSYDKPTGVFINNEIKLKIKKNLISRYKNMMIRMVYNFLEMNKNCS